MLRKHSTYEVHKLTPLQDQVTVVAETPYFDSEGEDVIGAAKRSATGQALPKQARSGCVPVRSLLNSDPSSQRQNTLTPLGHHSVRFSITKSRACKTCTKRASKKAGTAELVGKYHMLAELARAQCGLTFGQLVRDDADEAKREIR